MECAQLAVEAALASGEALSIAAPSGAVMAFNRGECPDGWRLFGPAQGRFVMGAGVGNSDEAGHGLTLRSVGDNGGRESRPIEIVHLPSHRHNYGDIFFSEIDGSEYEGLRGNQGPADNDNRGFQVGRETDPTGGGEPFNHVPPFTVLLFCERL